MQSKHSSLGYSNQICVMHVDSCIAVTCLGDMHAVSESNNNKQVAKLFTGCMQYIVIACPNHTLLQHTAHRCWSAALSCWGGMHAVSMLSSSRLLGCRAVDKTYVVHCHGVPMALMLWLNG
jgi:hypothetical protein